MGIRQLATRSSVFLIFLCPTLRDDAACHSDTALAQSESQSVLQGERLLHLEIALHPVAWHGHLDVIRQEHIDCCGARADKSLGPVYVWV